MRVASWLVAMVFVGCRPSATIEQTTPVANLQTYRTVALSVRSTAFAAQGLAVGMEAAVLQALRQKCGFEQIDRASATPADVTLDLNITATGRGGGGLISNSNTATIDTLLVLTDGQSGDLLGTARIRGKSSGVLINSGRPENEAIEVVAKTVAEVLVKSGCSGPRIARAPTPPDPDPTTEPAGDGGAGPAAPDESQRAEAEALNEDGKLKLRSADVAGALAAFKQANAKLPDARYQFNVCLAFEAGEQWPQALAACREARTMNPQAKLIEKIDRRIELLQNRR